MKRIYMMGDSTMQYNNIFAYPQTGWGQVLHLFAGPNVLIENYAKNGRSTKSFITEGRFQTILDKLNSGDYVICQFGHNDEKESDPTRYTNKDSDYKENLKYFADEITKKGASIIFATSITRLKFKNGICEDSHKGYPQAMLDFACANGYLCIDLNQLTINLYNLLGEDKAKKFHMIFEPNVYANYLSGKDDTSHLRYEGAVMVCELFVKELLKAPGLFKEEFLNLANHEFIDPKMLID